MGITNCPNCGAALGQGRYCRYCGTDTARTDIIEIKTPISRVPLINVEIAIPMRLEDCQNEETLRQALACALTSEIKKEIEKNLCGMEIKKGFVIDDPLNCRKIYKTKFCYAFI
jgi:hypothetical protein